MSHPLPLAGEELAQLLRPWQQIASKADAFFQQVASRYPGQLRCREGCDTCCQQDLSLSLVESLAVLARLRSPGEPRRAPASAPPPSPAAAEQPCALLQEGRCTIYANRPLICRTHGLMLLEREDPAQQEGQISVCPLNFSDGPPAADSILDATLLASALAVADGMARRALGIPPEIRYPISQLVAQGWQALSASTGG